MTTYATRTLASDDLPEAPKPMSKGKLAVKILTSTDHKVIGYLYLGTSLSLLGS